MPVILAQCASVTISHGVRSFSTFIFHEFYMIKNYANPLPIGIELATVVDCRRQSSPVGDSPHLSVTENNLLVESRRGMSAIQHIVNRLFYFTVSNLCIKIQ